MWEEFTTGNKFKKRQEEIGKQAKMDQKKVFRVQKPYLPKHGHVRNKLSHPSGILSPDSKPKVVF